MEKIILSDIAKYGCKKVKLVKPLNTKKYRKLVAEANERVEADAREQVMVYRRAKYYVARANVNSNSNI